MKSFLTAPVACGRAWDAFDGYLWDIDGTLLRCTDLTHYEAFNRAMSSLAGKRITIDGVPHQGNVDVGILRDAFAHHAIAEEAWRPVLPGLIDSVGAHVVQHRDDLRCVVLPAVRDVLAHLKEKGAYLGTATGNLEAVGTVKLEAAGLLPFFDATTWSDAHEFRADVVAEAVRRVRDERGSAAAVCVVGDTPSDVAAARTCGVASIAVATGWYTADDLAACGPDLLLASLALLPIKKMPL